MIGCYSIVDRILFFFFQAEDGIRYLVRSRGLGDVYKRQPQHRLVGPEVLLHLGLDPHGGAQGFEGVAPVLPLSLIHI